MSNRNRIGIAAVCLLAGLSAQAGTIGGTIFQDRNRNGVQDTGEAGLSAVVVELSGAEGTVSQTTSTAANGSYSFAGLGDGDYIVAVPTVPRLRVSHPNQSVETAPISNFPFGLPRYSGMARTVANLNLFAQFGASYLHMALGDSIGFGFSVCGSLLGDGGYIEPTTDRLARATGTDVTLEKQAIPGHETADLLIPGLGPDFPLLYNDVFRAVERNAPLISISIGGNDFLAADGGGDPSVAAALVATRKNIQEILSTLQTKIPFADIEINTVYDPEEGADPLYNDWVPIWNQVLRETAWGQTGRITVAEVNRDYAHIVDGILVGEPGLVCNDIFGLDGIHPTVPGYDVHEEKLWQSFGGVTLAGGSSRLDVNLGFQRVVPVGLASAWDDVSGNTLNPEQAIGFNNTGALVSSDSGEFRVRGFLPNPPAGVAAQSAMVKVRYRTTGAPLDDYYVIEASLDGTFSPAGATPATWNTIIPLVGSAGNDGAERLAFPDQPGYRVVSAPLYSGAPIDGSGAIDIADLSTLAVRVVTTAVGAPDAYAVELDAAYIEIFPVPVAARQANETTPKLATNPLQTMSTGELARIAKEGATGDRRSAARILSARTGPAALSALRKLAADDDDRVRQIAVGALAKRDGNDGILAIALGDDAQSVRLEAAAALLARGNDAGVNELITALDDLLLAKRARQALATHRAAVPALLAALGDESVRIAAGAARSLGGHGELAMRGVPALRDLLAGAEPALRLAAADALSRLGDTRSIAAIRELAADPRYAIDAARALGRYGDASAYAGLYEIARADGTSPTARRLAARHLALGGEAAKPALHLLLSSDDEPVRRLAQSGLARFDR